VGYDSRSKGHHVYWPQKHNIGVERNIDIIREAVTFEGESDAEEDKTHTPQEAPNSAPDDTTHSPAVSHAILPVPDDFLLPPAEAPRERRIRKPTQYILDIQQGKGSATGHINKPALPPGLQAPEPEAHAAIEDFDGPGGVVEYAFITAMTDADGMEPRTLGEVRKRLE
jgi:hypothetical protein